MRQSVHHKKDFTVVSMRVYGSFSNCHWSKHQDFVKVAARSQNGNEAARRRQDHERGERGPCPLGVVSAGEGREPVEVQEFAVRKYRIANKARPHARGREPQKTSGQGRRRVPPTRAREYNDLRVTFSDLQRRVPPTRAREYAW